jgi:hypothetical protein
MDERLEIRRKVLVEGVSKREMLRQTGMHWRTLERMLADILTVKHHGGFRLWQLRYSEQSVKNSHWKGGKGDVVREFADAVRAEGMDVGIYPLPADLFQIENAAGYYGDGGSAASR